MSEMTDDEQVRARAGPEPPKADGRSAEESRDQQALRQPSPELGEDELQQLREKAAERDQFLELLQRVRADYANYQKRIQKERQTERRYAAMPLVSDLLGVVDNLERAIEAGQANQRADGLLEGVRMVHQQVLEVLARYGVQPIEAEGQRFDPNVHEAMMEESSDEAPPGTVLRVLQRGYSMHNRVVRPAKVVVAAQPAQIGDADAEQTPDNHGPV